MLETYEPGDSPIGATCAASCSVTTSAGLSAKAEALLYAADRAEHVERVRGRRWPVAWS